MLALGMSHELISSDSGVWFGVFVGVLGPACSVSFDSVSRTFCIHSTDVDSDEGALRFELPFKRFSPTCTVHDQYFHVTQIGAQTIRTHELWNPSTTRTRKLVLFVFSMQRATYLCGSLFASSNISNVN